MSLPPLSPAAKVRSERDAEWSRLVLGIPERILTPEQAALWLKQDRIERARNVIDARVRRGPRHW